MEFLKSKHGKPAYLTSLVLYGVASVAFAVLLKFAMGRRPGPRRTLIGKATSPSAAVDAWENEGGAPAAARS